MLWFEMLMALVAVVALDLANSTKPAVFRRRNGASTNGKRTQRGGSDGRTRSARNS
jgi:hypothetical protein